MNYLYRSFFFFFIFTLSGLIQNSGNSLSASCNLPFNILIDPITLNSARINWKYDPDVVGWNIRWRLSGEQYDPENHSGLADTSFYTIENLLPNSLYYFQIKTVCSDNESKWSNEYNFMTNLTNPSACNMGLPIKDPPGDLYPAKTLFYIFNEDHADKKLGEDVFLQDVRLIIAHDWTSDLEIKLTSPSGNSFYLVKALQTQNRTGFGNPDDPVCLETATFSDNSCIQLGDVKNGFTGDFIPKEAISGIYDATSPVGIWVLEITDKYKNNAGILQYAELNFAPIICPIPDGISLIPLNDSEINVKWDPDMLADSVSIKLTEGDDIQIFKVQSSGSAILSGLSAGVDYAISLRSECGDNRSAFSCERIVNTLCDIPTLRETFDDNNACPDPCLHDCLESEIWWNTYEYDRNWLINDIYTLTDNTGPEGDVHGHGKYLFLESSPGQCETDTIAVIESACIVVSGNGSACDMSFYYHMYGVDIGSLSLEISGDNGNSWNKLFEAEGNMGNEWLKAELDLSSYYGQVCVFRFVGKVLEGRSYGDMAIDDIVFYGSYLPDPADHTFYPDMDGDGFGKDTIGVFFCLPEYEDHVTNNLDCDDENPLINPDAEEIKCNFIDENCNGMEDDAEGEIELTVTLEQIINETCSGRNDGSIVLAVEGGFPPYNFLWSDESTDSILVNAEKGFYNCRITDQTGCGMFTGFYRIGHEVVFDISVTNIVDNYCKGQNEGEMEIEVNGGQEPYYYLWSNGDSSGRITGLATGPYTVTVTDSEGCSQVSDTFEIKALANLKVGIVQMVQPACFGGTNGRIELKATEGTPPYSYIWSDGTNGPLINDISAGNYYCTITDADDCIQIFGPVEMRQPAEFEALITSIDHVTCSGDENGNIQVTPRGGVTPYSFLWTSKTHSDFISLNDDIYNLRPGSYTLRASDKNGCTVIVPDIEVTIIDSLSAGIDELFHAACARSDEGFISLRAEKGYSNYYYFWSDGSRESYNENLSAGSYSVTVTDDLGCKFVLNNIEIKNLNIPIEININILNEIKCWGNATGKIDVQAVSENQPYDFNWSAGVRKLNDIPLDTLTGLSSGFYNVTVTDNDGCVGISDYVYLAQPRKLEIKDVELQNILCFDHNTGSISINVNGGIQPYDVEWNDGDYSGFSLNKLYAGAYLAKITDSNSCTLVADTIFLTQPDEITVIIETISATEGKSDGSAILLIEGGVSPYDVLWQPGNQTGFQAKNLAKGWYTAMITDKNGCEKTVQVFINEIPSTSVANSEDKELIIYPNPAKKYLFIENRDGSNNIRDIRMYDMQGNNVRFDLIKYDNIFTIVFHGNIANGIYILKIDTGSCNIARKVAIIN